MVPAPENLDRSEFAGAGVLKRTWLLVLGSLFYITGPLLFAAADTNTLVTAWLAAQTNIQTWSADFVQTRVFKTLTQPLMATGQVFFASPNRFHWRIEHPAPTIAVRAPDEMLVFYPKLKRVERYPLTGDQPGPWRDALALLEAGFPRSKAEMEARLKIVSQIVTDNRCELVLQPRSAAARKMMPQIKIIFGTDDFMLRATELEFADGSTMRNDFTNAKLNPSIDQSLFAPQIPSDYKVIEPLKQGGPGKGGPGGRG
jgi:outer membrane lipoprotein-sorting protein